MNVVRTAGIPTLVVVERDAADPAFPVWSPEQAMEQLAVSSGEAVLIDLSQVRAGRSNLFGFLARLRGLLSGRGSRMVVLAGQPELMRTMEVLGLGKIFFVARDRDAAVRACRLEAADSSDDES